ncbi:MAG: secondary thiamine-phosphate synthase enzyme YjbQ [Candidatus Bathyarchaeia archaeon]
MVVISKEVHLESKRELDIIDVSEMVQKSVYESGLEKGIVTVFVSGSTGALTTIEYEPGLLRDLPEALERIAPRDIPYEHEKRWHDGNGHSHVRASLLGPSLTIPFINRRLTLGTWQQIIFIELDVRPRSRNLIIQIIGE